ncbi:MAG: hypothetical protein ACK47F_06365 [Flavobacteriales bacterium]
MQSLKLINDISDETFNRFLKELSFPTKLFIVKVREVFLEQGIVLTTKSLKESIVSFFTTGEVESKSDPLLQYLSENEDKHVKELIRFIAEMQSYFFRLNSVTQKVIKNKSNKEEIFSTLYDTIEDTLIQLGYTYRTTEFSQQVEQQLSDLIYMNFVPERKLEPNQIATKYFLQDMLNKLANEGFISEEFKNEQTQFRWIHGAFYIDIHNINQLEKESLKIDWNHLTDLADWLLYLKDSCVKYPYEDNKRLLEWVIQYVTVKKQEFSKGTTSYTSLRRTLRERRKNLGVYFTLDKNKLFKIQKGSPPPSRIQED